MSYLLYATYILVIIKLGYMYIYLCICPNDNHATSLFFSYRQKYIW